jgi:hypothetical protein
LRLSIDLQAHLDLLVLRQIVLDDRSDRHPVSLHQEPWRLQTDQQRLSGDGLGLGGTDL